jgi:hypothetical protein
MMRSEFANNAAVKRTRYTSQRLDERFIGTGRSITVSLEGGDSKNSFSAHKMFCWGTDNFPK